MSNLITAERNFAAEDGPHRQTADLLRELTASSASDLFGDESEDHAVITGVRRVLTAGSLVRLEVARYDEAYRAQMTAASEEVSNIHVGLLVGHILQRSGREDGSLLSAVYSVGEDGVYAQVEIQHSADGPFQGEAREVYRAATATGFGELWTESAFDALESMQAKEATFYGLMTDEQVARLNQSVGRYRDS